MNEKQLEQSKELIKALLNYSAQELSRLDYDGDEIQPMFHIYNQAHRLTYRFTIYHLRFEIENIDKGITINVDLETTILNEKEIINIMYSMN